MLQLQSLQLFLPKSGRTTGSDLLQLRPLPAMEMAFLLSFVVAFMWKLTMGTKLHRAIVALTLGMGQAVSFCCSLQIQIAFLRNEGSAVRLGYDCPRKEDSNMLAFSGVDTKVSMEANSWPDDMERCFAHCAFESFSLVFSRSVIRAGSVFLYGL